MGSTGAAERSPGANPAGGSDTGPLSGAGAELFGLAVTGAGPGSDGAGPVGAPVADPGLGAGAVVVVVASDLRLVLLRPSSMVVVVVGKGGAPGVVWADAIGTIASCDSAARTGKRTMRA